MEQVQKRYVKFKSDTLAINSIGFNLTEEQGYTLLPVHDFSLVEPFFNLKKTPSEYYPLVVNGELVGFRRKEIFESQIVLNTEDEVVRSLRSFENFIASARIVTEVTEKGLTLIYDSNYFDTITNQEHIDRLTLVKDKVYNLYVTRKGDPFAIYSNFEVTLEPFVTKGSMTLPYHGPKEISVYVVAKN